MLSVSPEEYAITRLLLRRTTKSLLLQQVESENTPIIPKKDILYTVAHMVFHDLADQYYEDWVKEIKLQVRKSKLKMMGNLQKLTVKMPNIRVVSPTSTQVNRLEELAKAL